MKRYLQLREDAKGLTIYCFPLYSLAVQQGSDFTFMLVETVNTLISVKVNICWGYTVELEPLLLKVCAIWKNACTIFASWEPIAQFPKLFYAAKVQCNLDLERLNLVTTCDLVTILQRPSFHLLHKIILFSDITQFSDSFCGDQKCH